MSYKQLSYACSFQALPNIYTYVHTRIYYNTYNRFRIMSHILTYCTLKMLNTVNLLFIIGGVQWDKHGYAIIDRFCERYLVYALEMLLSIPSPP